MLSILSYTFFQYALLGALLSSLLCACVGSYVVTRRLVIAGGGMAHASLGGVGMGAFFGFSPLLGAAAFALVGGLGIDWLSRRRDVRSDSAVAMIWTLGMSIGILFAYLAPGFMTDLPTYLFGDILSISRSDLQLMGLLTAFTLFFFFAFERIIVTVAYDPDFARTQGLPVRTFETALTLIMALTIVGCLRMVGIILVVSLLSYLDNCGNSRANTCRRALTPFAGGCVHLSDQNQPGQPLSGPGRGAGAGGFGDSR